MVAISSGFTWTGTKTILQARTGYEVKNNRNAKNGIFMRVHLFADHAFSVGGHEAFSGYGDHEQGLSWIPKRASL